MNTSRHHRSADPGIRLPRSIPTHAVALLLFLALVILFPRGPQAGMNPEVRLAIDVQPYEEQRSCAGLEDSYPSCEAISTSLPMLGQFVAVIVLYNFDNIRGVEFTVTWPEDWVIYASDSCGQITIHGDPSQNPMHVAMSWGEPIVAESGAGFPLYILWGNAASPGCLSIVCDYDGDGDPKVVDELFELDKVIAWSDGCIGTTTPDEPCAFGSDLVADFAASPASGPAPLEVSFTDLTEGDPLSWFWDLSDGDTSWAQHPTHVYEDCGEYTVSLQVDDGTAVDDTFRLQLLDVLDPISAGFSSSPRSGCVPLEVQFTDQSEGAVVAWLWEFGDGETSTERNPLHTYAEPGTYDVTLRAYGDCSRDECAHEDEVTVLGPPSIDSLGAGTTQACAPLTVDFRSLVDSTVTDWIWEFGDGDTSHAPNPSHAYLERGIYTVSLVVENVCGGAETTLVDYIRTDLPPEPDFGISWGPPCVGYSIYFYNATPGSVSEWLWSFGDGVTSTERSPVHIYQEVGAYDVSLTACTPCGDGLGTKEEFITIYPEEDCIHIATELQGPYAEVRGGTIHLKWVVSADSPYIAYNILRAEDPAGDFTQINEEPLPDLTWEGILTHEFVDGTASPGVTYYYRLEAVLHDRSVVTYAVAFPVALPEPADVIRAAWLGAPRPIPFSHGVEVELALPRGEREVEIAVYDALGRRVKVLSPGPPGGRHLLRWDGRDSAGRASPPGIYFFRLQTSAGSCTRKALLVK